MRALVLTVAKISQPGAGGYADYLQGRAQPAGLGDYYLRDGARVEAPGRWAGGADAFAIDARPAVTAEQLRALMAVRRPDTGDALRPVGANGNAVAAIDATFSAPKSVSVVWAVGTRELRRQIEAAHERAIDRTLSYATERVAMIRQRVGVESVIHTRAAGLVATSWRHTTARSVDGRPPDPQLHSHVLLHGASRADGRVMAIDSRAWFTHRRELGAAYRSELARELTGMGFEIKRGTGRGGRYFEIDGVPPDLVDRWSGRHHQVREAIDARLKDKQALLAAQAAIGGPAGHAAAERLEALSRSGQLSAPEDRFLTTATRAAKRGPETHADLDEHWIAAAREFGIDADDVPRLRAPRQELAPAAASELLARLTEFDSTFPDHAARAVALEASAGTGIKEGLATLEEATRDGEVIALADERQTTQRHRFTEHQTVGLIKRLSTSRSTAIDERLVRAETARLEHAMKREGGFLTAEQREAVKLGCSDRRLVLIEGQAGTGKSTVLTAIGRAHQAGGQQIVVTSTGALAAQRLAAELRQGGVHADSYSAAALHTAVAGGQLTLGPDTTVIHDEAALASTREQRQLFCAVDDSGARLIEVGDPQQSKPVGAGGLWPQLEQAARGSNARVELTRNVRALDPGDRRDQKRFRDGAPEQALAGYAARGRVIDSGEQRVAEDRALDAAHADQQAGQRTIVIAQTSNEHLDELNARAQAIRLEHGELGEDTLRVPRRPYELHAGDEIQIRRNLTDPDGRTLRNGTTGHVTRIDTAEERAELELADGQPVALTRRELGRADVRLAYVQHPFPAQGQTTDTAHVIVAEHATQEGSYVALTRARQRTHIYTGHDQLDNPADLPAGLAARMSRTEPEVPSIDIPLAHEDAITAAQHATQRPVAIESPARRDRLEQPSAATAETPAYVTATLGQPPSDDDLGRAAWEDGASAIQAYRARYQIPEQELRALGPEPPPGAFLQRHARSRAGDQVTDALTQLNRHREALDPLPPAVIADTGPRPAELDSEDLLRDRDLGIEP